MSAKCVGWALEQKMPPPRKLVLVVICDHADKYGRNSFCSYATIAEQASVSRRTAMRVCLKLEKDKVVDIERRKRGKENTSNMFTVKVPWGAVPSDSESPPKETKVVSQETPPGDAVGAPPSDTVQALPSDIAVSPKPLLNQAEAVDEPETPLPAGAGGGERRKRRYSEYQDSWNALDRERWGLPEVTVLNDDRKKRLKARAAAPKWDWDAVLAKIPVALGVHHKDWFTFDWLLKNNTNFLKLVEGHYDQLRGQRGLAETRQTAQSQQSSRMAALGGRERT